MDLRPCNALNVIEQRSTSTDVWNGEDIAARVLATQKKTGLAVQFEITESTRDAIKAWLKVMRHWESGFWFPSRMRAGWHLSTRQ